MASSFVGGIASSCAADKWTHPLRLPACAGKALTRTPRRLVASHFFTAILKHNAVTTTTSSPVLVDILLSAKHRPVPNRETNRATAIELQESKQASNMSNNSFSQANLRGIQCLQNHQYRQAASTFHQGLRLVQLGLAAAVNNINENQVDDDANDDARFLPQQQCIGCYCPTKEYSDENDVSTNVASPHLATRLHQSPFRIPARLCRCGCAACQTKMAFIFIFNSALAFHLDALASLGKNSRSLQKATKLYQMGQQIARQGTFPLTLQEYQALRNNAVHVQLIQSLSVHGGALILATPSSTTTTTSNDATTVWKGFLSVLLNFCVFSNDHTAPAA